MKNPIFAIGDIHGCYDELHQLMTFLKGLEKNCDQPPIYLFLGDYVDRGPKSMNVVEYLCHLQEGWPGRVICLLGNHDDMMTWGENHEYIAETLNSYGVNDATMIRSDHVKWIKKLPLYYQDHMGRVFVHAAIDRSLPLVEQTELTLLWGRDPYLSDRSMDGGYVVHGHSVVRSNLPEVYHNRCAVDTGCCFGRVLSAAIFDDSKVSPVMLINHKGTTRRL
jgi:serine/threonine protein phosphatase 1